MNTEITQLLTTYSIGTTVIAVIGATVIIVLRLILKKVPNKVWTFLPFVLGVALQFLYGLIFTGNIGSVSKTLSCGFLSGSLSLAFIGVYKKIKTGGKINNMLTLSILEIITVYTDSETEKFAENLSRKLAEFKNEFDEKTVKELIATELKNNYSFLSEDSLSDIKNAIYLSFKSLLKP